MFMHASDQQSTINPAFARHHSDKLRELTGELHRVYDNLHEIARGDTPNSTVYDRLRALRVLYDRGFGKVTKNQAHNSGPGSSRPPESEESGNHTNHSSDIPEPKSAASERPVVRLEQKLNDELGPPQAPAEPQEEGEPALSGACPEPAEACPEHSRRGPKGGLPAPSLNAPNYTPDLVRESQYYIMEITDYGDELASILMSIHEPDPEDDSIRDCHRITAGMMIIERVLGPVADLETPLDHWHDPSLEPNWGYKHPAEIDSTVPIKEMIEADRDARQHVEDMRKEREEFQPREETGPCYECGDDYPCEYHAMAEELSRPEDEIIMTARGMRNLNIFRDRLYFDERGLLRLRPPDYIDDS